MTELLSSTHFWLAVAFAVVALMAIRPVARLVKKAGITRASMIREAQEEAIGVKKEAVKRLEQIKALTTNKENIRKSVLKKALTEADAMTRDFKDRLKTQLRLKEEETAQLRIQRKERFVQTLKNKTYQAFIQKLMDQTLTTTDAEMEGFLKTIESHAPALQEAYQENPVEEKYQEILVQQAIVQGAYENLKKEETGIDDKVLEKILSALDTLPEKEII